MTKGGGKGRISNTLVAASCAAVLAVYAAGYWRTRGESRRMDARAQERRPVPPVPVPAPAPGPATNSAAAPEPAAAPPVPQSAAPPSLAPPHAAPSVAPPPSATRRIIADLRPTAQPAAPQPAPPETAAAGAPAPALAVTAEPSPQPLPDSIPAPSGHWRDGTYTGWGTSRHGDIKAQVVIRNGRIADASIASCETRYPCDVIGNIIPQPVARQSPDVDHVSRATESADAYYYALVEALKEAQLVPDGDTAATP